jgi:tRNA-dihydrouridine synthase B
VLELTGADGVMIGRAAQGRPWIFREVRAALAGAPAPAPPSDEELRDIILAHLRDLYVFYGVEAGVRIARKHLNWYFRGRPEAQAFLSKALQSTSPETQLALVRASLEAPHSSTAEAA